MTNEDDPLRGYRPAGPPPDLRARIMMSSANASAGSAKALAERIPTERSLLRDWLPALAVAALALVFAALSHGVRVDIEARLAVPDDLRPVEQWLPDDLGGLR